MSAAVAADQTAVPYLPRGVRLKACKVRGATFLLAPERAIELDPIGVAILGELDGVRSIEAIAADLAAHFGAPPDTVLADVGAFVADLAGRRMVEVR
ncbi:pyrroloquinoline quinone biosynthesis peptide chaperone PqqD [Acuticoccus sediminis]|uniref:Pyrroloquinoline quinone biosynthesis peptide chaperone PqqD n=1 Tax=Acuticoccus sediminis TaxID=2184697 RepID=A0A8B2NSJ2_9HYPH|nr:pyrroloquinoline quinone biosynthesis peptide chaperone PqqD [Acuticoccus sediminis]RAI00343.1 pyrroloquinoline quinone biosynthesis peptide chaperone PqqD [Acuticoccus sediminis]